jgi:uncharacterized protein YdeI (YjbR/CyaY-like superfamily)
MNPQVDTYLEKIQIWQEETRLCRKIILNCGLSEALKWGKPCYSYGSKNILVIQGFKSYFAILFFKGFLLSDPDGVLVKTGEHTQVGRQMRFKNLDEIRALESVLKAYIYEAIEVERLGLKTESRKDSVSQLPEEFQIKLDAIPALKTAFESLTPGRQRAYLIHFSGAKQAKTREARVEKLMPQILQGKGIDDL